MRAKIPAKTSKFTRPRGVSARSGIKSSGPGGPKLIESAVEDGSHDFSVSAIVGKKKIIQKSLKNDKKSNKKRYKKQHNNKICMMLKNRGGHIWGAVVFKRCFRHTPIFGFQLRLEIGNISKKRRAENYPRRPEIATNPLKSAQREKNELHLGP